MGQALAFPENFLWGTATASYQIEGGTWEDGRGESIWDRFARIPGNVHNAETGDVACNHYYKYNEDLDLLTSLGIKSYRFSIAWPRLFPEKGKFESRGLDFYKRLIEGLEKRGIEPVATIYHWDLPQWIQEQGGWTNRDTIQHYLEYARVLFETFGNRVARWITHNEPWCVSFLGYGHGIHAPGVKDWNAAVKAAHHLLLSHGEAVKMFRGLNLTTQIGITLNLNDEYPASNSEEDLRAADRFDMYQNRWFLDPLFAGHYPHFQQNTVFDEFVSDWGFIQSSDLETISQPIDFLGINNYTGGPVKADKNTPIVQAVHSETDRPKTDMGWDIYPEGLYRVLKRVQSDYTGALPLYITENGAAFSDTVIKGRVPDDNRINYLQRYFEAAHRFIQEGGPLRGYYVWSLMDNYEWAFGYSKRFGLVHVDYETQERTLKASAYWYRNVIRCNALDAN
ncbi:GH1 family beta-glucosidase [Alicyclobacillus sp. SO9]|uniref:GH1 family beta-glucosidase n=1 Tax=Alicyclobacillus sp. SO9 TaxID=2665646 RepID=UPI0018E7032A|nr:GH1 family beta-glucosidase [Alicyclobacillus sp. SO9]QQE77940.1 beta-glucosidase [Alicyclobacillus sp. SO9]